MLAGEDLHCTKTLTACLQVRLKMLAVFCSLVFFSLNKNTLPPRKALSLQEKQKDKCSPALEGSLLHPVTTSVFLFYITQTDSPVLAKICKIFCLQNHFPPKHHTFIIVKSDVWPWSTRVVRIHSGILPNCSVHPGFHFQDDLV